MCVCRDLKVLILLQIEFHRISLVSGSVNLKPLPLCNVHLVSILCNMALRYSRFIATVFSIIIQCFHYVPDFEIGGQQMIITKSQKATKDYTNLTTVSSVDTQVGRNNISICATFILQPLEFRILFGFVRETNLQKYHRCHHMNSFFFCNRG